MYRSVCILVFLATFGSAMQVDSQCAEEAGFTEDELSLYDTREMPALYYEKAACYQLCLKKKEGKANDDGTFIYTGEPGETESEFVERKNIFDKCANERAIAGNPCRTFFNVFWCVSREVFNMELEKHLQTFDRTENDE